MPKKQLLPIIIVCIIFVVFVTLTFVGVKQNWDMTLQWVCRLTALGACALQLVLLLRLSKSVRKG